MTTLHTPFRLMTCLAVVAALLAVAPWAISPAAMPPAAPPELPAAAPATGSALPIVPPPPVPAGAWPAKVLAAIQPPTDLVAPTPFDNLIPAPPAPPVVAAPPARKPLEGPIRSLNFKDASLHSVLEYLSAAAGLVVVETVPVESRITVISLQPLSIDETVALLNTALKEKGYAAVRTGRTLKIMSLADAKKAAIPVTSGGIAERIEPSDQIVTHIIPVQFADVTQLKTNLTPLLPSYADLQANTALNALILTATQTNVRHIVEVVHTLDTQGASVSDIKVFQLQYASATSAATLITNMFKADASATGGGPRFGTGGGGGRGGGPGGGGPGGGGPGAFMATLLGGGGGATETATARQPKVTAQADDRTNSLVVSASGRHPEDYRGRHRETRLQPHGRVGDPGVPVAICQLRQRRDADHEPVQAGLGNERRGHGLRRRRRASAVAEAAGASAAEAAGAAEQGAPPVPPAPRIPPHRDRSMSSPHLTTAPTTWSSAPHPTSWRSSRTSSRNSTPTRSPTGPSSPTASKTPTLPTCHRSSTASSACRTARRSKPQRPRERPAIWAPAA